MTPWGSHTCSLRDHQGPDGETASGSSSGGCKAHSRPWRAADLSWTPQDSPVPSGAFQFHSCLPLADHKPTSCLKSVVCIIEQSWGEGNGIDELSINNSPKGFHFVFLHHLPESFYQHTLQVTASRAWEHLVPKVSQHWMSSFKALTSKSSSLSSFAFL